DAGYSCTFILPPLLAATSSPKRLTPKLTGWSALLRWPKRIVRSWTSWPKAGSAKPTERPERPAREMARRRGSINLSPSRRLTVHDAVTSRTAFHYGIRLSDGGARAAPRGAAVNRFGGARKSAIGSMAMAHVGATAPVYDRGLARSMA